MKSLLFFFLFYVNKQTKKSHPETKSFTRFVLVCFFMFLPKFLVLLCQAISTLPIKKPNTQRKKKMKKIQRSNKIYEEI